MFCMLSTLLFACLAIFALAVPPSQERLSASVVRDPTRLSQSGTVSSVEVQYSTDWAGAILHSQTDTIREITGRLVIPTPRIPIRNDGKDAHYARIWVGVDGDVCESASIRVGCDLVVDSAGNITVNAFYHAFPGPIQHLNSSLSAPGASMTFAIALTSNTTGTVYVTEHTLDETVAQPFKTGAPLCQQDAEWVVENIVIDDKLLAMADFGTVTFTNASAVVEEKQVASRVGTDGARVINIWQDRLLTDVALGASSVAITYLS
ncbi:peptidase G1 domain-containing protein [Phanerochaete sordida]|uniref:Peptidase G1 domain-containing protein n=1 Tax=Phanerochaete sordida TaxID=48140 RepID=A0A9P3GL88_9APHY|nr:peptidase G1 domain-containing protein [Phanerochaete sordida]